MSKIQTIKIKHFKSIDQFEADFKGCTAIVTGGNNKGKTSLLRGIADRIRFIRPDIMVKNGENEGNGEMTLTTGEKFIWEFDSNGKDRLTYVTDKGIKKPVTVELGEQFFPPMFDIDKFLQSSPKKQAEQLQKIVGVDFTEIDERYRVAYDQRTERNKEAERYHVKLTAMLKVPEVHAVDLSELQARKEEERKRLNDIYLVNKKANEVTRDKWIKERDAIDKSVSDFNEIQKKNQLTYDACYNALFTLKSNGFRSEEASTFVSDLFAKIEPEKVASDLYPSQPTLIEEMPDSKNLDAIDAEIFAASKTNADANKYADYISHKEATEAAKDTALAADLLVKEIEQERLRMIESAQFPKGVSITSEGITVDGLPLDRNQISTSKLYCSALRIASMKLGEVKTLYFDASFLDRISLSEIEAWASENDLQLLIERPDFDGGEIKYELIEN